MPEERHPVLIRHQVLDFGKSINIKILIMFITRSLRWWLASMVLAYTACGHAGAPRITFSCWLPAHSAHFIKLEAIYRQAFAALGYEFVMQHRPTLRAIQDANHGTSDGECARDTHYLASAPESPLIRIDVVVASADLQVWSHQPDIRIDNLSELNSGKYRLGYMQGSAATKSLLTPERQRDAQGLVTSEIGIKMLSAGRIDALIISEASVKRIQAEMKLPKPIYHAGTLFRQSAYVHLHPRHRQLVPALTRELRLRIPESGISLE